MKRSVVLGRWCSRQAGLALLAVASVLVGTGLVIAPAASAGTSTFAVTEVPFFCCVNSVAADPATDTVYAAATDGNQVSVIDGASDAVSGQITLPTFPTDPVIVAVDQASDTVFAIETGTPASADVINGATDALTATISLPAGLMTNSVAVNPVTHLLYVLDDTHNAVIVIDPTTDAVAATIPVADPFGLAVDSATNTVYVPDFLGDQVTVIDGATNAVTGEIALPGASEPTAVAVDSAAGLVYTADEGTGSISVIDIATDGVSTLASGMAASQPGGLALDSGSGTLYWTVPASTLGDGGTTYAIGTASGTVTQIPRGGTSVAVGASGGSAFIGGSTGGIADQLLDDVTVITPSTASTMSPVIFGSNSMITFVAGVAGRDQLTASATPGATFSAPDLPGWLSLSASGLLSGTPPANSAGSQVGIHVTAANGVAPPDTEGMIVTVEAGPPVGGVLGDVTGNGLDDILAIDGSGNLWLYPNTGSGNAGMFADGRSQVGSGWNGYTLAAVAPLYGAAEAGLVAIDPGGNLWYYPNTGGTGTATFGRRSLIGIGWTGYTVVGVTDLYGTGQPGILAIDPAGNLWYYPNTGGTGTGTFGARSQVGSGWTGYLADVADFNGGSPDILAVDPNGTMWLYPNTDGGTGTSTFGDRSLLGGSSWGTDQAIDVGQLTSAGPTSILNIDQPGDLLFYQGTGGTGTNMFDPPVQVGTGWTGYRIN